MKRNLIALVILGFGLQAGTASAEWAFDDPYWKMALASAQSKQAQAGMITSYERAHLNGFEFVTDFSPL
jgi:hypothetical protein